MGWLGKVIGGTIGFALGGPLGAIAGAVFGHAFDSGETYPTKTKTRLAATEASQLTFFVATFSMLAKLAKSDGRINREEIDSVEKFMLYDLKLEPESRRIAMNIFQAALDSPGTFNEFAAQFYQQFQSDYQLLELMIDILLRVSIADGRLSPSEENLILNAVHIFRFEEERYRGLKALYVKDIDRYYAVLKSNTNDSDEQIRSQYRQLVHEFHPDKVASKGLPEEFSRFAQDKFREIQEAYEIIKKERGIK